MRIAIPTSGGELSPHFAHARAFAIIDVDPTTREIENLKFLEAPEHQPGLLPRWLKEMGATVIISAGMGHKAQNLFEQNGIEVVIGAKGRIPGEIARTYLGGELQTGQNLCDH